MKIAALFAAAAIAVVPIALPAGAATDEPDAPAAVRATDLSAAKKKKKRVRSHVRVYPAAPYGYVQYPQRWRPADPSIGPYHELHFRRSIGECVIDLGYGRWEGCHRAPP